VTSVKDLKSDHKNARRRTDRSASLIAESLKRFGAARSIVIDEDGRILAGNGTVEGAKKAGIDKLRIIEAEGDELDCCTSRWPYRRSESRSCPC
jgi:ParB-like chromosome segregation protein Spo0J